MAVSRLCISVTESGMTAFLVSVGKLRERFLFSLMEFLLACLDLCYVCTRFDFVGFLMFELLWLSLLRFLSSGFASLT